MLYLNHFPLKLMREMQKILGEENNTSKPLNQRVTLRTVDNFQGEEAKIVIISLVRNCSGNKFSSIGFLKSKKMGRPSRLSSDGDLLNCDKNGRLSRLSSDVSALTLHFGSVLVSASIFQFESPTRAFGYAATGRYDDETASDDDSEDNSMVKSYQKNLDCIFQGKFYAFLPTF
ncbi:hypothetical protein RhiirA4_548452 [Rhizophagus irregularis]|uniref:DNA2/NAM7 helicase-like C-terminal domain-containing protein n=1 Tax=Rhizophagus irregularis TaxID=588596 RepID=A0A2I1H7P0_9GLOM|nr:hypothetical protein RhiirA4_548452 [Rhizophagus irregularis]